MENQKIYIEYYTFLLTLLNKYRDTVKNYKCNIKSNKKGRFDPSGLTFDEVIDYEEYYKGAEDEYAHFIGISHNQIKEIKEEINKHSNNFFIVEYLFLFDKILEEHEPELEDDDKIFILDVDTGISVAYSVNDKNNDAVYDLYRRIFKKALKEWNKLDSKFKDYSNIDQI